MCFFFSSRRRHTRWTGDWSSDVCSSDLTKPDAERPYRAFGYPYLPGLYILGAAVILLALFIYRASTTWPGLVIVIAGIPVYYLLARSAEARRVTDRDGE